MGLRTASTTSPTSGVNDIDNILSQNDEDTTVERGSDERELEQRTLQLPNASVYSNMAPALTEPISQTSKLSSSTTSASPRPISNNLIINNHTADNNNIDSNVILESSKDSLNGAKIVKEVAQEGTFQLAFEKVIAKEAAAAARRRQLEEEEEDETSLNGPVSNHQMGPMCDSNTSNVTGLNFEDNLADNQIIKESEDEEGSKIEEEEKVQEQERQIIDEQEDHMDVSSCDDKNNNPNEEQEIQTTTPERNLSTVSTTLDTTVVISETTPDVDQSSREESTIIEGKIYEIILWKTIDNVKQNCY